MSRSTIVECGFLLDVCSPTVSGHPLTLLAGEDQPLLVWAAAARRAAAAWVDDDRVNVNH